MPNDPLWSMVMEAARYLVALGLALGVAVGVLAVVSPGLAVTLSRFMNTHYSLRRKTRFLELPVTTERFFYRHHRVFGAFITLAAAVVLYVLLFRYSGPMTARLLAGGDAVPARLLVEAFYNVLALGSAFSLVTGVVVFLRPSLLRGLEVQANRWLSTRQATRGLNRAVVDSQGLFEAHPRVVGGLMALVCAGVLLGLFLKWPA